MLKPISFRVFEPVTKNYIYGGGEYVQHSVLVACAENEYRFSVQFFHMEFIYDITNGYWGEVKFNIGTADAKLLIVAAKVAEKFSNFLHSNYELPTPRLLIAFFKAIKVKQVFHCNVNKVYYSTLDQKCWTVKVSNHKENFGTYVATDIKDLAKVFKSAWGQMKIVEATSKDLDTTELRNFYDNNAFKIYHNE